MRDGKIIQGKITDDNSSAVTILTSKGNLTLPRKQILKVEIGSDIENKLLSIQTNLTNGEFEQALIDLESLTGETRNDVRQSIISTLESGLGSGFNRIAPTRYQASRLSSILEQLSPVPASLSVYEAYVLALSKQPEKASSILSGIHKQELVNLSDSTSIKTVLETCIMNSTDISSAELVAQCRTLLTYLPISESSLSKIQSDSLMQINYLIERKQYEDASSLFSPGLAESSPAKFTLATMKILRAIESEFSIDSSMLSAIRRLKTNVYPILTNEYKSEFHHIENAVFLKIKDYNSAERAANELSKNNPDSGATLLHRTEFYRKKQATESNPVEFYKLASWAKDMGLYDEAIQAFSELRNHPAMEANSKVQLEIVTIKKAGIVVGELQELYENGKFEEFNKQANTFLQTNPPTEQRKRVLDLIQLAAYHKWQGSKVSLDTAEADYQQGERLFNQGDFQGALTMMNKIETNYDNLVTVNKAKQLRQRIVRAQAYDNYVKRQKQAAKDKD